MGADIAGSHQQSHQGRKKGLIRKAEQLGNRLPQLEGQTILVQIMQIAESGKLDKHPDRQILHLRYPLVLPEVKGKILQTPVIVCLEQFQPFGLRPVAVLLGKMALQTLRVADTGSLRPFISQTNAEGYLHPLDGVHDEKPQPPVKQVIIPYRFQPGPRPENIQLDLLSGADGCPSERVKIAGQTVIPHSLQPLDQLRFEGLVLQPPADQKVRLLVVSFERLEHNKSSRKERCPQAVRQGGT